MSVTTSNKTLPASSPIARLAHRLRGRLQELGLCCWVWDSQGRPAGRGLAGSPFCEEVLRASPQCQEAAGLAACRALAQKAGASSVCPCGGCLLAVPVQRRRRVLGAVTVCFPVLEALEDGTLGRHGKRLGLEERTARSLAARSVRHSRRQAGDFLRLLSWLIESEEAAETARGETETLSANLASTYEELSLLYLISGSMKVNQPPEEFFRNICQNLVEVMHLSAAAAVVHAHAAGGSKERVVRAGDLPLGEEDLRRLAAQRLAPRMGTAADGRGWEPQAQQRAVVDNEFRAEGEAPWAGVQRLIAAPMVADESLTGMLIGFNKATGDFDSVDLKLITSIANQSAVFVANHGLYAEVQDLLMGVLHALTSSVDAKDPYTSGHSARVAVISRRIAERMGVPPPAVQRVYLCGLLHDIGKIGVAEEVLRKPGRLTAEEYEQIKQHPAIGARILGGIRQLDQVVVGIYTHHERLDGKGYPQGLSGDAWPLEGRIIGLADAFDAMTSRRPYREALPLSGVLEELRRLRGVQFDPGAVEAFLSMDVERLLEELRQPACTVFPAPEARP